MTSMDIWTRFQVLEHRWGSESALPALPLPSLGSHYLAKGSAGEPVLLLRVQKRHVPRIPLGLRHVQVEFDVDCAVFNGEVVGGSVAATFCRCICDPNAPGLHPMFVYWLVGAVEGLPSSLTAGEVDQFFGDTVELFRSFSAPAKTSILGLWGELLIIASSPCRNALMMGWHVTPEQAFDFSFPTINLEAKTTVRHNRQHSFSLTQLRGGNLPAIMASIVAEQSDAGESVFDLAAAIQEDLTTLNRVKLWRLVAQSVGSEAEGAEDIRLLRAAALNSMRFYNAEILPAPEVSAAAAICISAVRFSLDLDRMPALPTLEADNVWRTICSG